MRIAFCIVPLLFIYSFLELSAQNTIAEKISDIERLLYYYPKQAEKKLLKLNQHLSLNEKSQYKNDIQLLEAFLFYQQGEPDSALITIQQTLSRFITDNNIEGQAKCHLIMAWVSEGLGYWDQAIINYYKCTDLLNNQSSIYTGIANIGVARCNRYSRRDYTKTLTKGIQQLKEKGSYPHQLFADFSYWSILQPNHSETIGKLENIANKYLELNLNNKAANSYRGIAYILKQRGQIDSAEVYVDKGLSILNDSSYPGISKMPVLLQFKGTLRYMKKDYHNAEQYLYQSIAAYDKYNIDERKHYPYLLLCRIDTINNNYQLAFEHLSKATKYQNRAISKQKQRLALVLEISAEVDNLKADIKDLKWQRTIVTLIAIIGFLLFTLLVYYLINLYKKRQRRIRAKNRELHNLIVGMNEKILLQKRLGVNTETIPAGNITIQTLSDHFDICYHETYQTLLTDYPQLSRADSRYALMFSLGMSTDAICQIQSVQKSTVRKAKFRIREKLDLDATTDLEQFFKPAFEKSMAFYQDASDNGIPF
ncbi:hypothetical protein [Carboxylicivirga sp. RSCT41]|uniref:hypothetical protein n=1 Tax=Carboxylicivirga agarovorans TaxID=3417570 RepID=UPI003D34E3A4